MCTLIVRGQLEIRVALVVAAMVMALSGSANATYDWGFECTSSDAQLKLKLEVWFNSRDGGVLSEAQGAFALKAGPQGVLKKDQVKQWWTSAKNFNIQFGTEFDDWTMTIETGCKNWIDPSCNGTSEISWNLGSQRKESKVACTRKPT
jgi:hypothetical protein